MAHQLHYYNNMDVPEIAAVCLSCDCVRCEGICDRYRNAWRAYNGLPPLPKPTKREKKPYEYQHTYTHGGETHTLREWARITGQPYMRLYMRMWKYGMSFDEAIVI